MSPTERTMELLRKLGWTPVVVERWNSFAKIRQDLFGFQDIQAIHPNFNGVLAIQTTSGPNVAARIAKAKTSKAADNLTVWLLIQQYLYRFRLV